MTTTINNEHKKLNVPNLRFPEFQGEWEEYTLQDVVTFSNGKAHENCVNDDGDYILVNSKFVSTNGQVQKRVTSQLSPLHKSQFVMVMSDLPNGKALAKCFYVEEDNKYTLNQRVCSFTSNDGNVSRFLMYQINRNTECYLLVICHLLPYQAVPIISKSQHLKCCQIRSLCLFL
jgi:type I restriction enzyme S subunit